nr:DUF3565 domain-containing protein [Calditrichia bacterium]
MKRNITGFHRDRLGDWVADLDCGHSRHMRHNPPLANRPWLNSETERIRMLGVELDCQTCDDLAAARV